MNDSTLSDFAKCLRRIRKERGLSQEKLAFKADVDRSYLGRIEQGKVVPTLTVMEKLAKGLGINVSEMCRTDTMR